MSKDYQTIHLKDYQKPSHKITQTQLNFHLDEPVTEVTATLSIEKNDHYQGSELRLNGEAMKLISVAINDKELNSSEYKLDDESLTLLDIPDHFELTIKTALKPKENLTLSGLYQSSGNYCTQCEAHGFRRITYYLDRPDCLSEYFVRIEADKNDYPVLLSNGNLVEQGDLGDRHWVKWHDPHLKPAYLFALVAGTLDVYEDSFITVSKRKVALKIFVEPGKTKFCQHAMDSLKRAMKWDEDVYGREYDLDIFMIVAVSDFNMGAMENKGLNIFNDKYILADSKTATDQDFQAIEGVVAHEYFHNWTGNRVTCRDWFQLSLKEGLTVFRDQEFSRDMNSRVVNRIEDVARLKQFQFKEDQGPNSHPVQPQSYIEVNNFYTATVYEKGAELIRMLHTIVGKAGFRKGTDLYFDRHDGQAVTIEDFVAAIADANQIDLSQFLNWYKQAGTPIVAVTEQRDASNQTITLSLKQTTPDTPGQTDKQPVVIPIQYALITENGTEQETLMMFDQAESEIVIENAPQQASVSLFREFSAPVKLNYDQSFDDMICILQHDSDGVNRYQAAQKIFFTLIKQAYSDELSDMSNVTKAYNDLLGQQFDNALKAKLLILPGTAELLSEFKPIDVNKIHQARQTVLKQLVKGISEMLLSTAKQLNDRRLSSLDAESLADRSLRNTCLSMLASQSSNDALGIIQSQFDNCQNMTDKMAALKSLVWYYPNARQTALEQFYQEWQDDHLVLDKWFSVQAMVPEANYFDDILKLTKHEKFTIKNPNRLRSLLGPMIHMNPILFHQEAAYAFLADTIEQVDAFNPQIASRLCVAFENWQSFAEPNQQAIKGAIDKLLSVSLSKDSFEILSKAAK